MTDKEVLSQEEIDALLSNVSDEEQAGKGVSSESNQVFNSDAEKGIEKSDGEIQSIDFSSQERIVRGQLPVLERIYERFSNMLIESTYELMSRDMKIEQKNLGILKFNEFMSSLDEPSSINTIRLHPLRGKALVVFDKQFVFSLVDNYFGGRGQYNNNIEDRDFTQAENRVIAIFFKMLLDNYSAAWSPIKRLQPEFMNLETNPQLVNSNSSSDLMVVNEFDVSFDTDGGSFFVILPYPMIEPIREELELGASQSDDEIDPNWVTGLRNELLNVNLLISSNIATAELTLGRVNELKVGDFIPVDMNDLVTLDIEGVPTFIAKVGTSNDKCALKIMEKINY